MTMTPNELDGLLAKSFNEIFKQEESTKEKNTYYVAVTLPKTADGMPATIGLFLDKISKIPKFKDVFVVKHDIIIECEDENNKNLVMQDIHKMEVALNKNLINQELEKNWLTNYLSFANLKASYLTAYSREELKNELSKKTEMAKKDEAWRLKNRSHLEMAGAYNLQTMESDITDFMYENWEGFPQDEDKTVLACHVSDMLKMVASISRSSIQLDKYPCQLMVFAMNDKAQFINDSKGLTSPYKDFFRTDSSEEKRTVWLAASKSIRQYLGRIEEKYHCKIQPKGFKEFCKEVNANKDSECEVKSKDLIPFKGIPFESRSVSNFNEWLTPTYLKYALEDQGRSLIESLSGTIAAYYLDVIERKQEYHLEQSLFRYSEHMTDYFNDMQAIFDSCKNVDMNWLSSSMKSKDLIMEEKLSEDAKDYSRVITNKHIYRANGKLLVEEGAVGTIVGSLNGKVDVLFDEGPEYVALSGCNQRMQSVPSIDVSSLKMISDQRKAKMKI